MSLVVVIAPTVEPLTVEEVQSWCKATESAEAEIIESLISEARRHAEVMLGRALAPQTLAARFDTFPCWGFTLERSPVTSITSIQYVDTNGDTQMLSPSSYQADLYSEPPRVTPAYGESWPSTRCQMNAVTVTYIAGYAEAAAVPGPIRRAIAMLVAHWFENREAVLVGPSAIEMPMHVRDMLMPWKVWG